MRTPLPLRNVAVALLAALLLTSGAPALGAADPASLLPADCLLFVSVPNVEALKENFKKTSLWGLYKEPAMQAFMVPAEQKARQWIDEKIKEAWTAAKLENPPQQLPWPQGQVLVAMRLGVRAVKRPVYDFSEAGEGGPKIKEWQQAKTPLPQLVVAAEMGKNFDAAKELLQKVVSASVDHGWRRQSETVRGVDVVTMTAPPREGEQKAPDSAEDAELPAIACYAFKDTTILAASDGQLLKDVLARMVGQESESLGDDADYKAAMKALPLAPTADVKFYLAAKPILQMFRDSAGPRELPNVNKVIRGLGVDNIGGLAAVLALAPKPGEEARIQAMLSLHGPAKSGIPAILSMEPMSTKPSRLLTKGLDSFAVANLDVGKAFDLISRMVLEISGAPLDMSLQMMMMATATNGEGGRPAVDLRKEVFSQLGGPITLATSSRRPFTAADASRTLLAIGVRDGKVLESALARIHDTFIAQGNKDLRREMLNQTLYLLRMPNILAMFLPIGGGVSASGPLELAFAVAGDQFVFGRVGTVEQVIRDQAAAQVEGIEADPMYQYASKALPAQAGAFYYANSQVGAEQIWIQVKEAAKKAARQGGPGGPPGAGQFSARPLQAEDEQIVVTPQGGMPSSLLDVLVQQLHGYFDFTALPDFQAVRKYFGASVGYLNTTDQGLYFENVDLSAPPAK